MPGARFAHNVQRHRPPIVLKAAQAHLLGDEGLRLGLKRLGVSGRLGHQLPLEGDHSAAVGAVALAHGGLSPGQGLRCAGLRCLGALPAGGTGEPVRLC